MPRSPPGASSRRARCASRCPPRSATSTSRRSCRSSPRAIRRCSSPSASPTAASTSIEEGFDLAMRIAELARLLARRAQARAQPARGLREPGIPARPRHAAHSGGPRAAQLPHRLRLRRHLGIQGSGRQARLGARRAAVMSATTGKCCASGRSPASASRSNRPGTCAAICRDGSLVSLLPGYSLRQRRGNLRGLSSPASSCRPRRASSSISSPSRSVPSLTGTALRAVKPRIKRVASGSAPSMDARAWTLPHEMLPTQISPRLQPRRQVHRSSAAASS